MWSTEHTLTTDAPAAELWRLLRDISGWASWNDGIASIEVDGPVAVGTAFVMTPPGEEPLHSRVVALVEGELLTDETAAGGVVVTVEHRLTPAADGQTTISYRVEITGPAADEAGPHIGPAISGDFPEVMGALAGLAGSAGLAASGG